MSQSIPLKQPVESDVNPSQQPPELYQKIATSLGCHRGLDIHVIQRLWGGYGELVRLVFTDSSDAGFNSVIVKHVALPDKTEHPKGWNTKLSHQRKVPSYHVETAWYQSFPQQWDERCPVPCTLSTSHSDDERTSVENGG